MRRLTDYEEYQLKWMIEHDYSLNDLIEHLEEVRISLETSTDGIASIEDIFAIWEEERGSHESEIWACENEWKIKNI